MARPTDIVPLQVRMIAPQAVNNWKDGSWVRVKGQVQFLKVPGKEQYIPVLMLADNNDITKGNPGNEYEQ